MTKPAIQTFREEPSPPADAGQPRASRSGAEIFSAVRAELAALDPATRANDRLTLARLELDAMLAHALASTEAIIGAAEAIALAAQDGSAASQAVIAAHLSDIFVACAFQDVTAQRARRLEMLLEELDGALIRSGIPPAPIEHAPAGSLALEEGPALPGAGNDQDAVDMLIAEFEKSRG